MTTVTTFNVNQFSSVEHQRADLTKRMKTSDVVLCQETVDLDLEAFASKHPGWAAFQIRRGDNDGHANTGVLYRKTLGEPTATDCAFLGDVDGTRARFLTAVRIGVWWGSAHIEPKRFAAGIPEQLHNLEAWCKTHPGPKVIGLDRNQCHPSDLERASGLDWHGVDIDGFLTNQRMTGVDVFPKGFSDHPGVHADVETPAPRKRKRRKHGRIRRATALLREALRVANRNGRQDNASRVRRALAALAPRKRPGTRWPAIGKARKQSHEGPPFGVGMCLQQVRVCFGIPALAADAIGAWSIARAKHRETNPADIPRGFPVFWSGGSHGHGHIAISAGGGKCWSTDIERPGFFDYVDIAEIHAKWGLTLLGYTDDLNGRPVK